jgi:hypothetical protein
MDLTLYELSLIYPFAAKSPQEMELQAELWMEDLGHLSADDFKLAIRMHRASSARFPTPADIKKHYETIIEDRRRRVVKLPEASRSDEEQREINKKGYASVRRALSKAKIEGKSNLI